MKPRGQRPERGRPPIGVVAHALGVLALIAGFFGLATWQLPSRTTAAVALVSARWAVAADTDRDDLELRVALETSTEKAHLAARTPLLTQAARARAQDPLDLRLFPAGGAALLTTRDGVAGSAPLGVREGARRGLALHEAAPESAGHRASNPARGPPAHPVCTT